MARQKNTPGQNQSITKKAAKNFKLWNDKREDKTEVFKRCKSVKYWYVSDKGTVISFQNSTEPVYLKIFENKHGYKYVTTKKSGVKGTQYIHRLQAEAFNIPAYGKAKNKPLDVLEVHHTEADKRNEPDSLQILEPGTHDKLFDKKTIPSISDDSSKHFEYMDKISKVVQENTPDQAVIVFPGTGIINGEETKDLTQAIYADDFPGVTELVNQAVNEMNKPKPSVFEKEGYIVLYPRTLYTHTVIKTYHKEIIEHIKKADQEEHMAADTKYPITIKYGDNIFDIWVMKKPMEQQ